MSMIEIAKDSIKRMPIWLKILLVFLILAGIALIITGGVIGNAHTEDHERGEVVNAAVRQCLLGIGGSVLMSAALSYIAHLIYLNYTGGFAKFLQWFCIIGGVLCVVLSIIIGTALAKNEIAEYDRLYSNIVQCLSLSFK